MAAIVLIESGSLIGTLTNKSLGAFFTPLEPPSYDECFYGSNGVYLSFCEKYGKIINNGAKDLAIANEFKTGMLLDVL